MSEQENFFDNPIKVRTVGTDERIQVSFLLLNELVEDLPRTFDDFYLAVCLCLANEVDHFRHDQTNLVPLKIHVCGRGEVSEIHKRPK